MLRHPFCVIVIAPEHEALLVTIHATQTPWACLCARVGLLHFRTLVAKIHLKRLPVTMFLVLEVMALVS